MKYFPSCGSNFVFQSLRPKLCFYCVFRLLRIIFCIIFESYFRKYFRIIFAKFSNFRNVINIIEVIVSYFLTFLNFSRNTKERISEPFALPYCVRPNSVVLLSDHSRLFFPSMVVVIAECHENWAWGKKIFFYSRKVDDIK
jgi:hypothetical protein